MPISREQVNAVAMQLRFDPPAPSGPGATSWFKFYDSGKLSGIQLKHVVEQDAFSKHGGPISHLDVVVGIGRFNVTKTLIDDASPVVVAQAIMACQTKVIQQAEAQLEKDRLLLECVKECCK